MNDPIEDRLRADAARRHEVRPPSFDDALDAAISGGKPRQHVTLTSLGVAASVVLVAGLAFGLSGKFASGGPDSPGDATSVPSEGPILPGVVIEGLRMDRTNAANPVTVVVAKPGISGCALLPVLTIVDESATTVHLSVVTHQRSYRVGTGSPVPSAYADPSATQTDPGATQTDPVPTLTVPVPTPTPGLNQSEGASCVAPDEGTVDLRAAVGSRTFYVNGKHFVVLDEGNNAEVSAPPTGYAPVEIGNNGDFGAAKADLSIVNKYADGNGGIFWVSYGPPEDFPIKGSVTGHVDIKGITATVSASSGQRWLTWTLPTGAVMQVYSRAAPPLSIGVMAEAARSVIV